MSLHLVRYVRVLGQQQQRKGRNQMAKRTYKFCRCCGTKAENILQRKCKPCGVYALWDKPEETDAETDARIAKNERHEQLMRKLLGV